ncbi:winged helix DNA-binding protein [Tolypothrix campylonemoides VB511288]|nr:winged helix DNA-binding protein [Tolypothrix campylonemoides VB511288]
MLDVSPHIPADQLEHLQHIGLLHLLCQVTRVLRHRFTIEMNKRGHNQLHNAHSALLANMDVKGICLTDLAERAGMTKQAMRELLIDLERKGYVERRADPKDKRAKLVYFTEMGHRAGLDAQAIEQEIQAEFEAVLGVQGVELLRTALITTLEHDYFA